MNLFRLREAIVNSIGLHSLDRQVRPIDSGALLGRNERLSDAVVKLLDFLGAHS